MEKTLIDGRYRLGAVIGADRFGEVHDAVQEQQNRRVSIKIFSSRVATDETVARFAAGAAVLSRLHHKNLVFVTDHGVHEGRPYLVRDAVDGETLEQRIEEHDRFPPAEVLPILIQIADALEAAHKVGIKHFNLQPACVIMDGPRARVADAGLVSLLDDAEGSAIAKANWYQSPEQAKGKPDERSDLYSLGAIGYRMLAGRMPFEAQHLEQMLDKQAARPAPPIGEKLDQPEKAKALSAIIDRLLFDDPNDRFPSAEWVSNALRTAASEMGVPVKEKDSESSSDVEMISAPDIEDWAVSTSTPGTKSASGLPSSPAIEDWVVPDEIEVPEPTFWAKHRENVKIALGAAYLIAIAVVTFHFAIGLPDASREVRGMIRRRQAPQVIPQLLEYASRDNGLRAALGLAYVHVRDTKKAIAEYAAVAESNPDALHESDLAGIVLLLGVADPGTFGAEKILLARPESKARLRAAYDASTDPYYRCRAGEVLTKMSDPVDFLPACREALSSASCGARRIAIARLVEHRDAEAKPKLLELSQSITSTLGEDCGYAEARKAL
jgi:serine/threonine protein kinase